MTDDDDATYEELDAAIEALRKALSDTHSDVDRQLIQDEIDWLVARQQQMEL